MCHLATFRQNQSNSCGDIASQCNSYQNGSRPPSWILARLEACIIAEGGYSEHLL